MKFILLFALLGLAAAGQAPQYNGAHVLRVVPKSLSHIAHLTELDERGGYDFWKKPGSIGRNVDIMAPRNLVPILKARLQEIGLDYQVLYEDLQQAIDAQIASNEKARDLHGRAMDWNSYHTYDEINEWIDTLPGDYPGLVTVSSGGQSYEGREMKLITVSQNGGAADKAIFIDGGIHAREWISPATVSFMLNELLMNSANYADTLAVVDFYFMISINPDGYDFTFTDDRMWRKTRSPNEGSTCMGTDPNRNWDYHWGEAGASTLPCADTYMGTEPFSEVECRNVRDQVLALGSRAKAYLTFHSYGQYILYPFGYDVELAPDWQDMHSLGTASKDAIEAVYGTVYEVGDSGGLLYPAAGASDDWAKGVALIKYSYTYELRDTGDFGFLLPEGQIIPTGQETFKGFEVIFEFVRDM